MFRYEYAPLLDDVQRASVRRSRFNLITLTCKRKGTFIWAFAAIFVLICFAVVHFFQKETVQPAVSAHQDCRKIEKCSVCVDEGCVWTNSSKHPCRYDGSDFERAVVVPCVDVVNRRELYELMASLKSGHDQRLEWSLVLQIVSYVVGIIYVCTRFYLRRQRRQLQGWQHQSVMYRPLERVLSGDIENVELISLI